LEDWCKRILSSRSAWATQWDPISKNQKQNKSKMLGMISVTMFNNN
jgi:hypothetical protein